MTSNRTTDEELELRVQQGWDTLESAQANADDRDTEIWQTPTGAYISTALRRDLSEELALIETRTSPTDEWRLTVASD